MSPIDDDDSPNTDTKKGDYWTHNNTIFIEFYIQKYISIKKNFLFLLFALIYEPKNFIIKIDIILLKLISIIQKTLNKFY